MGLAGDRALHDLVIVGGHADHTEIGVAFDQCPHPFADDQVVVRQQNIDRA